MAKGPIIWEALEYDHSEKTHDWYWAVGIIGISIALIALILGNIIFAIVVLVSVFALVVAARRTPKIVRFELNTIGVKIDEEFMPFNTLRSFWVENNVHHDAKSILYFKSRSMTAPLTVIPIDEIDPDQVRVFLLEFLLEEEHNESIVHRFMEYLGF